MGREAASFDRSARGEQSWEKGPAGSCSSRPLPLPPRFPSALNFHPAPARPGGWQGGPLQADKSAPD